MPRNPTVWLTRPSSQVEGLADRLRGNGMSVLLLPMMEIEALSYDQKIRSRVLELDRYGLAFFISSNAARLGMECVESFWPQYPAYISNYALGPGTAAVLEEYGIRPEYPQQAMSSETVLALPQLARDIEAIKGDKRALIFRGVGGRELLAGGLREKGVEVDYLELYRRRVPQYSDGYLLDCIERFPPDALVVTSGEALETLTGLFEPIHPDLKKTSLYVSSERLRQVAIPAGFEDVLVMTGADDQSIINALDTHKRK